MDRRVLLHALQDIPATKVFTPTAVEIEDCIAAIGAKYPIMGEEREYGQPAMD